MPRLPVPIWDQIDQALLYPLSEGGWLTLLFPAALITLGSHIPVLLWRLFPILIAVMYITFIYSRHLKWQANGRFGHPPIFDIDFGFLKYGMTALFASFMPAVIFCSTALFLEGPAGRFISFTGRYVLFPLGIFILPMSFLAANLLNRRRTAFNYIFICRSIVKIFREYFTAVTFIMISLYAEIVILSRLPFLRYVVIGDYVAVYCTMIHAYVLGQLYYNNAAVLGWFTQGAFTSESALSASDESIAEAVDHVDEISAEQIGLPHAFQEYKRKATFDEQAYNIKLRAQKARSVEHQNRKIFRAGKAALAAGLIAVPIVFFMYVGSFSFSLAYVFSGAAAAAAITWWRINYLLAMFLQGTIGFALGYSAIYTGWAYPALPQLWYGVWIYAMNCGCLLSMWAQNRRELEDNPF
ncbi:MAG: hypothetical protein ACYTFY_22980 [Planctomycetota bacterium]